LNPARSGRKQR